MNNKSLIAVWGSPSSGKTLTTVKLAQAFAAQKQNVLILCCDALCPSISTIAPQEAAKHASLGELLSLPSLSQEDVLRFAMPLDVTPHIALLGYKKGDNAFTYAAYNRERVVDLLTLARHLADVVLVDCSSFLSADPLSTVALELADHVVRLHSCDLKSLMFYASYLPLVADARFRRASVLPVLSNVKPSQDSREYRHVFGGIQLTLPHVAQLEQQTAAAKLLEHGSGKEAIAYQKAFNQLLTLLQPQEGKEAPKSKVRLPFQSLCKELERLKRLWPKRRGEGQ
ncbi:ParA family protein [Paenibacillus luteus]|uniref:ParA family protein n=1 Tax=Paenibacillus luteus TaxID=2545753 RepID=UPI0011442EF4|nr:ParA family protein [Paenibacillus luteus]